jgi:hypothetical protein
MFNVADMDSKSIDKPLAAPVWLPNVTSVRFRPEADTCLV